MRPCARATWERVLCFGATDVWMFPVIRFGSVPEWQKPLAAQRRVQDRKLQILDEDFVAKPVRLTNLTYGTMNHKSLPLLLPLSVFSRRFFSPTILQSCYRRKYPHYRTIDHLVFSDIVVCNFVVS